MKKIISIICATFYMLTLLGCSGSANGGTASSDNGSSDPSEESSETVSSEGSEQSLINITGIYYGEITGDYWKSFWSSTEGLSDCIVTFELTNDDTNRTMPDASDYSYCDSVMLTVGPNSYKSVKAAFYSNSLDRYSTMSQVLGYGNVLGGADTIKMFASFYVNPNDLAKDNTVEFDLDGIKATADTSIAKPISHAIECLGDENSEERVAADLLGRCDTAFVNFAALIKKDKITVRVNPGPEFSLMKDCMKNCWSAEIGASLDSDAEYGGDMDLRYEKHFFSADLKGFDLDLVKEMYPEIAENIDGAIAATNEGADTCVNPSTTTNQFQAIADRFTDNYVAIINYFSIDVIDFD